MTVSHARRPRTSVLGSATDAHFPDTSADRRSRQRLRLLGAVVMAAGVLFTLAGAGTWLMVSDALGDERITVAEDAARFGGSRSTGRSPRTTRPTSSSTTRSRPVRARRTPSWTARTRCAPW